MCEHRKTDNSKGNKLFLENFLSTSTRFYNNRDTRTKVKCTMKKNNKVTIKVFSWYPDRIRDKLCCKGQGCIKSIEILPPPPPPKPTPKPDPPPTLKPPTPKPAPAPPRTCCSECYAGRGGGPRYKPCYGYWAPIWYYDGYCGRPVYDSWGGGCGGGYYGCCCRGYYWEQNQFGCSII